MIRIEVYFDPVCPWCYIGKARLDRALGRMDHGWIRTTWNPFLLNPDIPDSGVDRTAYLHWKFNGEDGARLAYDPIVAAAAAEQLEFNPDSISRTPNTVDAHRLLIWAEVEGLDVARVIDELFSAYFVYGLDISQKPVLTEIAGKCGMDEALAFRLLGGSEDRDTVRTRNQEARDRGVDAVPCCILSDSIAIHGAQPPEFWESVFGQFSQPALA